MILNIILHFISTGTTDSSISEEDPIPPPLPIKLRDVDYTILPSNNENYSFLYSHRNSSLRTSFHLKSVMTDPLEMTFDDSDVPPTPPPKPPKIKTTQGIL